MGRSTRNNNLRQCLRFALPFLIVGALNWISCLCGRPNQSVTTFVSRSSQSHFNAAFSLQRILKNGFDDPLSSFCKYRQCTSAFSASCSCVRCRLLLIRQILRASWAADGFRRWTATGGTVSAMHSRANTVNRACFCDTGSHLLSDDRGFPPKISGTVRRHRKILRCVLKAQTKSPTISAELQRHVILAKG
ncbi:MAG: hypothetical protein QOH88_3113 [Verrucomicrobiota bacterium]